jgi:hypothetical protein
MPGNVTVTKRVNPTSGSSPAPATYTITIRNNTGAQIVLNQIQDDMTSVTAFTGTACTLSVSSPPSTQPCPVPVTQPNVWTWTGALPLDDGATATMTIVGTFAIFPPPGPGTPTPAPQQFCNPGAVVTYNTSSTVNSGSACFTLN